jgi:hypothetical protein
MSGIATKLTTSPVPATMPSEPGRTPRGLGRTILAARVNCRNRPANFLKPCANFPNLCVNFPNRSVNCADGCVNCPEGSANFSRGCANLISR